MAVREVVPNVARGAGPPLGQARSHLDQAAEGAFELERVFLSRPATDSLEGSGGVTCEHGYFARARSWARTAGSRRVLPSSHRGRDCRPGEGGSRSRLVRSG